MSDPDRPEETPPAEPASPPAPARREDLDLAVVHAAAVLRTLAENQRALRETVERADRTELLMRNVSGLNETFRSIATVQGKLLEAVEASEGRQRRSRLVAWGLVAGILVAGAAALFGLSRALDARQDAAQQREAFASALRDASTAATAERAAERREDSERLAGSIRDALSDRKALETRIAELGSRATGLETSLHDGSAARQQLENELASVRRELDAARAQLEEQRGRILDGDEGLKKLLTKLEESRAKPAAAPDAAPPSASEAARTPAVPPRLIDEVNVLLGFGGETELRLLEATSRDGAELGDVVLSRYGDHGRPRGLVYAKRLALEESNVEPRIRVVLRDGYELVGSLKAPFDRRVIPLRGVAPDVWRDRLPDLLAARSLASAPLARPTDPALRPIVDRLNRILAAHTDYGRYRVDAIGGLESETLVGVDLVTLAADGRVDQRMFAQRATLGYSREDSRLEIELEEGTRGRERPLPFSGGKLRLIVPGVEAAEVEGDPALPFAKR
ncbi:MAG TPA: hypothetical protein VKE69_07815 [Planctomycetota bacterium]|nr:hypothetical protein [Planctomycetota bacterium]